MLMLYTIQALLSLEPHTTWITHCNDSIDSYQYWQGHRELQQERVTSHSFNLHLGLAATGLSYTYIYIDAYCLHKPSLADCAKSGLGFTAASLSLGPGNRSILVYRDQKKRNSCLDSESQTLHSQPDCHMRQGHPCCSACSQILCSLTLAKL